ncbi:MAG TPA: hypothetical protein VE973_03150 [Candidatus Limnocylindria bacterium]|nr:hypothetical protein [Candidatus Limnocylindria bacterium]
MESALKPQYKIKRSVYRRLAFVVQSVLNAVFKFFSLKKSKNFWGIVYDSATKQPLDPVIVKLLYANGGEVETCVTDIAGRYGFLARPGKFKIFAKKTNYAFPSKYILGGDDGIYENIYHGEFFVLLEDSEVVAPNIPMDAVNFDWNQQAKKKVQLSHPFLKLFISRLIAVLFWFGLAFCLLAIVNSFPNVPHYLYYILFTYPVLIILAALVPETRLWGEFKIQKGLPRLENLFLELHNAQFPDISFGHAAAHENGKFLLRASAGRYLLTVSQIDSHQQKTLIGVLPVTIGRSGVLKDTIKIKKAAF